MLHLLMYADAGRINLINIKYKERLINTLLRICAHITTSYVTLRSRRIKLVRRREPTLVGRHPSI